MGYEVHYWSEDGKKASVDVREHVPDDWTVGWRIVEAVDRELSRLCGLSVQGMARHVIRRLLEMEDDGLAEMRHGPSGFIEWRRRR